ncbi:MAG: bifunctional (p)ppGpp synthetase/guanosine-3',5'-bis(diphosphate) 3'-pyrophosphohydrolase [Lutibacter sp.]|nr:bifunctional (p)ppGpp synthetase/guanosine-3',5'-bis(diphosphate) 3'-pyrophosphohydrolase [Lutibacter sp.]
MSEQNKTEQNKDFQDQYIETFSNIIKESLDKEGFEYRIKGRKKSIYSIRKKMVSQGVTYDEIYDKFAIRIIYKSDDKNEKFDAWKIYSIVTDHFRPNPGRMRDWISQPKSTGYESLHITVMGPQGKWVEVQIRSFRMDEIAEKGYAAHYKYKNKGEKESGLDDWINKIKESFENQDGSAIDFVEDFKLNLYAKEIFIFTPNGELKALPKHATALDFAFSIHTQIGMSCRGAKINGKLKPISQELLSGDQVEIITSKSQKPTIGWLDFVITSRARNRIKNALKDGQKRIAEDGKEILTRKMRHLKINLDEKVVNELVVFFKLRTSLDLFYRIGNGFIDNNELKEFIAHRNNAFMKFFKNRIKRSNKVVYVEKDEISDKYDSLVFGAEEEKLDYKISMCCNPIPGDKVFGFVTINDGIKIHKLDCPNAISLQANYAYRIIPAKWIDSTKQEFKVVLKLRGVDQVGLVNEITQVISKNMTVNILNLNFSATGGIFEGKITVSVKNKNQLEKLTENIKKIEGIDKIDRIYKN